MRVKVVTSIALILFLASMFSMCLSSVAAQPSGMVSYWKLDEGAGTIAHDSVGTNHGTLDNGPVWTTGQVDGALSFDGVDDYVDIPSVNWLNDGVKTFETWFALDRTDKAQALFGEKTINLDLVYYFSNSLRLHITPHDYVVANWTANTNWNHLVVTIDGTDGYLYLNGSLTGSGTGLTSFHSDTLVLGSYYGHSSWFLDGKMDEVAIYNRALTPEEVQQHYENGLSGEGYSPCVSGWTTWYEPYDNNTNGWTFVNGAGISGGVLDTSPTYSRGLNSLVFLDNLTIDSMTIDYDAYRSSSSSAIVGIIFSYLDYKVYFNWNYYGPHSVNGVWYRNSTQGVSVPLPQESGWRKMRIVLTDLDTGDPRASYYFQNEGVLKTIATNQTIYYYPGLADLPESTAIRMGNGYSGTVQYDNLAISYHQPVPEYTLTIESSPTGVSFTVDGVSNTTPWSETYCENVSIDLEMPDVHTVGDARYYWNQWSDANPSRSRTITMTSNITLTAYYTGPYYELTVASSPMAGIPFTINGTAETTSYTEWLLEGYYTLEMPQTYGGYVFSHWFEDDDTNRIKTILLQGTTWTAVYEPAPPQPAPVGGKAAPIAISANRLSLLAPYIGLTILLAVAVATIVYVKKRKFRHQ